MGGQPERTVEQDGGRAEHWQREEQPREAPREPGGEVDGERERDGGRGPRDARRESKQEVTCDLGGIDAAPRPAIRHARLTASSPEWMPIPLMVGDAQRATEPQTAPVNDPPPPG